MRQVSGSAMTGVCRLAPCGTRCPGPREASLLSQFILSIRQAGHGQRPESRVCLISSLSGILFLRVTSECDSGFCWPCAKTSSSKQAASVWFCLIEGRYLPLQRQTGEQRWWVTTQLSLSQGWHDVTQPRLWKTRPYKLSLRSSSVAAS